MEHSARMYLPHRNQPMYPPFEFHGYPLMRPSRNGFLPAPVRPSVVEQRQLRERRPVLTINSFSLPPKASGDLVCNDFFSFLEQKAKPMSELNPFASEFSLVKHNRQQLVSAPTQPTSAYKVIFDDLIESSLQSIDAIKKASKVADVHHVATQCNPSVDQIDRSTQTSDDLDQQTLLRQYSAQAVRLTSQLHDHVAYLLSVACEHGLRHQLKMTSHLSNELCYLVSNLDQTLTPNPPRSSRVLPTSQICLLCQKPVDDGDDVMHKLCRLLSSPRATNI